MARKGGRQYENDVRGAIARSTGIANAGTRTSASNRIRNDSMLARQGAPRYTYNNGAERLLDRMGVPRRGERDSRGRVLRSTPVRFRRNRANDRTVTRHDASRKDPTTGFGMNVQTTQKAFKVSFS